MANNRNHPPAARAREVRALAGVIAGGMLTGGVAFMLLASAAGWTTPQSADAAASAVGQAAPATKATAKTPAPQAAAKPATGKAAAPAANAAAPAANAAAQTAAPAAKSGKSTAKAATAMPGAVVQSEHLDDQVAYQYNALGRRDPFQALMGGEYVGADVGGDAPPDVGGLKVVGIVWGDADQFALVEDARGDSHILRRGDKVMNGYVETLKRDAVIVNLTLDGQSQSVRLPLTRKGDKANASR